MPHGDGQLAGDDGGAQPDPYLRTELFVDRQCSRVPATVEHQASLRHCDHSD